MKDLFYVAQQVFTYET